MPARLDHPLRRMAEASGRPRRLVARPRRPGAGRACHLVHRGMRARRASARDREAAARHRAKDWLLARRSSCCSGAGAAPGPETPRVVARRPRAGAPSCRPRAARLSSASAAGSSSSTPLDRDPGADAAPRALDRAVAPLPRRCADRRGQEARADRGARGAVSAARAPEEQELSSSPRRGRRRHHARSGS